MEAGILFLFLITVAAAVYVKLQKKPGPGADRLLHPEDHHLLSRKKQDFLDALLPCLPESCRADVQVNAWTLAEKGPCSSEEEQVLKNTYVDYVIYGPGEVPLMCLCLRAAEPPSPPGDVLKAALESAGLPLLSLQESQRYDSAGLAALLADYLGPTP